MVEKIMKSFFLFIFLSVEVYALQISEIFPGKGKYFENEDKYIEIYNHKAVNLKMEGLSVLIYTNEVNFIEVKLTNGFFTSFLPFVNTTKKEINSNETFVIISKRYTNTLELLPFSSNCIIFNPRNETSWGSDWQNRLRKIEILYNGLKIGETPILNLQFSEDYSFSFDGTNYVKSFLSPGVYGLEGLWAKDYIVEKGDIVRILGNFIPENGYMQVTSLKSGIREEIKVSKDSEAIWVDYIIPSGLENGENLLFEIGNRRIVLRYIDWSKPSENENIVFINEIVGDAQIDYSGGGWTGQDGGGTINATDDWVEILILSNESFDIRSCFFLEETDRGFKVKKNTLRTNANFSGYKLIITTPEDGLSQKAKLYLFDSHPYKGGKIIDSVEYGKQTKKNNFLPSLASTSIEDEALCRVIQGKKKLDYLRIFKKKKATFLSENSPIEGFIVVMQVGNRFEIYVADKSEEGETLTVFAINKIDREILTLKKEGFYFYGTIDFTEEWIENSDNKLSVGKGSETVFYYVNKFTDREVREKFTFISEGWEISKDNSEINDVVVYPNPITSGVRKIKIANIPFDTEIFLLDKNGNIIKNTKTKENFLEWEENFLKGFYLLIFSYNGKKIIKRLFVF